VGRLSVCGARIALIERQIQQQDVHARFAKNSELARLGHVGEELSHNRFAYATLVGDARHLKLGGCRREMRIEPGRGCGHEILWKGSTLNRFLEEVRDAAVQVVPFEQ
jgi:hypothetical protein